MTSKSTQNKTDGPDQHDTNLFSPASKVQRNTLDFGNRRATSVSSRGVRLRLLAMMGLLLAVIVAMKEAGKPERWAWMGFDRVAQNGEIDTNAIIIQDQDRATKFAGDENAIISNSVVSQPLLVQNQETQASPSPQSASSGKSSGERIHIKAFAESFWLGTFQKLNPARQLSFFLLLRKIALADLSTESTESATNDWLRLLKILDEAHADFQTRQLGEVTVMKEGPDKQQRLQTLFAFEEQWKKTTLPTLRAAAQSADYSFGGQLQVKEVLSTLTPTLLDKVQDLGGMGVSADLAAWLIVWDRAMRPNPRADAPPVTFLQLSGQPAAYRGSFVHVSGRAKTVRWKPLNQSETRLPVTGWYEIWIDPEDAGDGLFCVYASGVPENFTGDKKRDTQFQNIDVPVSLSGVFFKVRSYRDLGGGVSHAPVVVAKTVGFVNRGKGSGTKWQPSSSTTVALLSAVGLVSIVLAFAVYRGSRTRQRALGTTSARRMHRAFEQLAGDDEIKSDAQRVADLQLRDDDASAEERTS